MPAANSSSASSAKASSSSNPPSSLPSSSSSSLSSSTIVPLPPFEAGRGRWIGIRFPPARTILTPKQLEAEREKRIRNTRAQLKAQRKALLKSRKATSSSSNQSNLNSGLCGLFNLGNTCFLNSAIQCLSFSLPLTEYFHRNIFIRELNQVNPLGTKGQLALAYGKIIKQMWRMKQMEALEPKSFKTTIGKFRPQFSGNQQHDAQEFLSFLLDGLHEDLNRVQTKPYITQADSDGRSDAIVAREQWMNYRARDDSIIVDLYTGLLKSSLQFNQCGRVSTTFDPYTSLSLPLPKEKIKHLEITLIRQDSSRHPPRKFCVEFNARKPLASAVLVNDPMKNQESFDQSDEDDEESEEEQAEKNENGTAASSVAPDATHDAAATSSTAANSKRSDRSNRKKGMASSTRILDVKYALSRLCSIPVTRLQIARLQLSNFDIYKRTQFHFLSNFTFLSEFSLALQNSSGIYGNKNDCYYAFELPLAPTPAPSTTSQHSAQSITLNETSSSSFTSSIESVAPFHDGMPNKYLSDSSISGVPHFHPSPQPSPSPSLSLSSTTAVVENSAQFQAASTFLQSFPVSYGGVNGFVLLGMKFDVRDSVNKWELATVKDIRMLISTQSMKDMGGVVTAEATLNAVVAAASPANNTSPKASTTNDADSPHATSSNEAEEDDGVIRENSTAIQFRADDELEDAASPKSTIADKQLVQQQNQQQSKQKTLARFASSSGGSVAVVNMNHNDDEDDGERVIHFDQDEEDEEENDERRTKAAIIQNLLNESATSATVPVTPAISPQTPSIESNATTLMTASHTQQGSTTLFSSSVSSSASTSASSSHLPPNTTRFSASSNPNFVYQHLMEIPRKLPSDHPVVELYFTFDGFSPKWNEWVSLASPRIAPYGSGLTKTHGRTSGSAANPNAAYLTGPPPSVSSFYGAGVPHGHQFHNPLYTGSVFESSSYSMASMNGENEVAADWIRLRVIQRCMKPIPNSNPLADAANDDSTPSAVSGVIAAATGSAISPTTTAATLQSMLPNPRAPFDMQFFSIPLLLWIDPHTTTYQQLFELVWSKVKGFVKIPDWVASEGAVNQPASVDKKDAAFDRALADDDDVADVQQVSIHLNPNVEKEVAEAAAAPLLTSGASFHESLSKGTASTAASSSSDAAASTTASASSSSSSASDSTLPACFDSVSTAPFTLRFTTSSGAQCSKCYKWNKECLGCCLNLQQETVIDPPIVGVIGGGNFEANAPKYQRDVTLINSHHRRSVRDWTNDCTIALEWNPDYITCNLIDIAAMSAIELDQSCVSYRERERLDQHNRVDLNICMSMFTSTEKLEGDAAVYCSKCKTHENATKTLELYSTPPILVLHLKRLLPDTKLYTEVQFPLEGFDPRPFLSSQSRKSSPMKGPLDNNNKKSTHKDEKKDEERKLEFAESDEKDEAAKQQLNERHDKALADDVSEKIASLPSLIKTNSDSSSSSTSSDAALRIQVTQVQSALNVDEEKKSAGGDVQLTNLVVPQPQRASSGLTVASTPLSDAIHGLDTHSNLPSRTSTPTASPSVASASTATIATTTTNAATSSKTLAVASPAVPIRAFTPVPDSFDASAPPSSKVEDLYDLYAVVNHHGAIGGGHYICYCLDRSKKEWYRFDDSRVTKIDRSAVVTNSAYMLFYERRGLKSTAGVDACPKEIKTKPLDSKTKRLLQQVEGDADACNACSIQ